jgi:hypothetical protein
MKYRVLTEVSSFDDGRSLLVETDSLSDAMRECAEWAEYDDIFVWVENASREMICCVDGYGEAVEILEN